MENDEAVVGGVIVQDALGHDAPVGGLQIGAVQGFAGRLGETDLSQIADAEIRKLLLLP